MAVKAVYSVDACSPIFTRVDLAVVNVYLAVFPSEALEAITFVAIWFVPTFPFILTRVWVAVIDVPLALNARKAWQTLTLEPVHQIVTLFGVLVMAGWWVDVALVDVDGAVNSFKTRLTVALVPLSRSLKVLTTAPILARVYHALIDFFCTCGSSEALSTITEE